MYNKRQRCIFRPTKSKRPGRYIYTLFRVGLLNSCLLFDFYRLVSSPLIKTQPYPLPEMFIVKNSLSNVAVLCIRTIYERITSFYITSTAPGIIVRINYDINNNIAGPGKVEETVGSCPKVYNNNK